MKSTNYIYVNLRMYSQRIRFLYAGYAAYILILYITYICNSDYINITVICGLQGQWYENQEDFLKLKKIVFLNNNRNFYILFLKS